MPREWLTAHARPDDQSERAALRNPRAETSWHPGLVANSFTARGVDGDVRMSNGATDVFFDVLSLAGSAQATTPWQQQLTLHFRDSGRMERGFSEFDLADLPWTQAWPAEKDFFLRVIDLAGARHGWDKLHYDPPYARNSLLAYRAMLAAFTPGPVTGSDMGDWTVRPTTHQIDPCPRHGIFRGEYDCRLCDTSLQPRDAPKVWELISSRQAAGRLIHREVRQIPEDDLPAVRQLIDFGTLSPAPHDTADIERVFAYQPVEPPWRDRLEAILGTTLDPSLDHSLRVAIA